MQSEPAPSSSRSSPGAIDHAERRTLAAIIAAQQELLRAPPDADAILRTALDRVIAITGADGAALETIDGEWMRYRAASGCLSSYIGLLLRADASLSGLCARTATTICCPDVEVDARADREACRRMGVRSMALVPLRVDEAIVGALKVVSGRTGAFDDHTVFTLEILAGVAAGALARADESVRRERAEAALRRSEENFRTLVERSPDGVVLARHTTILYANEAFARALGYDSAEELRGRSALELLPEEQRALLANGFDWVPTEGTQPLEQCLLRKDGTLVETEIRVSVLPYNGIPSVLAIVRDVTDRRKLERNLHAAHAAMREQRDRLLRLQEQKEDLTRLLVHDFKSPLAVVQLEAQFLADDPELPPAHREAVSAITEAVETTLRMVSDLLDISRSEDGALSVVRSEVDVRRLLDPVCDTAVQRAASRRQSLAIDLTAARERVCVDASLVRRVIENLFDNAMKYAGPGGEIALVARTIDGALELSVSDTGPGIPDDFKIAVFDRYSQLERDARARGVASRGLGLAFCKLAVEAHGGRIWVEDAAPRGSRFCAVVPGAAPSSSR